MNYVHVIQHAQKVRRIKCIFISSLSNCFWARRKACSIHYKTFDGFGFKKLLKDKSNTMKTIITYALPSYIIGKYFFYVKILDS